MAAPQITPLPPAPQRQDAPADFVTKADAHVASLVGFVDEANTQAAYNDERSTASGDSAAASEVSNLASASEASDSSDSAAAALVSENNASDHEDAAIAAAAAAGAAAGLPAFTGNSLLPLRVNASETGVEYADVFPDQTGNSGKVLMTNGTTKSWEEAPNDVVFISTSGSITGVSTIDVTLPAGYTRFTINILNAALPSNQTMQLRTSSDGGSSFDSGGSDYRFCLDERNSTSPADGGSNGDGNSIIELARSGDMYNTIIDIMNPLGSSETMVIFKTCGQSSIGTQLSTVGAGLRDSAGVVDAIRIIANSVNFSSGEIRLYGHK